MLSASIKNSQLVSVKVTSATARAVQGSYFASDKETLTYLVNGSLQTKFLSDSVTLSIPGVDQPVFGDLYKEDKLDLTVMPGIRSRRSRLRTVLSIR